METEIVRSTRRKKTVEAKLVDGVLRVLIPSSLSAEEEAECVAEMKRKIVAKTQSRDVDLPSRAHQLADAYGLPQPRVISFSHRQNQRWGSCTPEDGSIRISHRLAAYPKWVLDYVIVHELAHLSESNHTETFWQLVNRYELAERARGFLIAKQTA